MNPIDYAVLFAVGVLVIAAFWPTKSLPSFSDWLPKFPSVYPPAAKSSDTNAATGYLLQAYDASVRASDYVRAAKISAILNEGDA